MYTTEKVVLSRFFEYQLSDCISDFFFSLSFSFVLKELIQTERDYVKSLGEVVEVSNLRCRFTKSELTSNCAVNWRRFVWHCLDRDLSQSLPNRRHPRNWKEKPECFLATYNKYMSGIKREYGQTNRCTADVLTILVALWFIFSLMRFFILVNYYIQVSFNFKLILPKWPRIPFLFLFAVNFARSSRNAKMLQRSWRLVS